MGGGAVEGGQRGRGSKPGPIQGGSRSGRQGKEEGEDLQGPSARFLEEAPAAVRGC